MYYIAMPYLTWPLCNGLPICCKHCLPVLCNDERQPSMFTCRSMLWRLLLYVHLQQFRIKHAKHTLKLKVCIQKLHVCIPKLQICSADVVLGVQGLDCHLQQLQTDLQQHRRRSEASEAAVAAMNQVMLALALALASLSHAVSGAASL